MKTFYEVLIKIIKKDIVNVNYPKNIYKNDLELIELLFHLQLVKKYEHSKWTKSKFIFFKTVLENIFINSQIKETFLYYFSLLQRVYFAVNRFAFLYKYNKSKLVITDDLYLNPINESSKYSICIYQNNNRYLFMISDLVNIMNTALSNSHCFFSEPLQCKNPYNNLPFHISNLYNIYFKIKQVNSVVPELIHLFFLVNFNVYTFEKNNFYLLREYSIKNYIHNTSEKILFLDIKDMIHEYLPYNQRIIIHPEFPKKRLVEIMKPYLLLYFFCTK